MPETNPDPPKPTPSQHLGCVALIVVLVGGMLLVAVSIWRINAAVSDFESRFTGDGWTRIDGPTIDQETPIDSPTLLFGGTITLHGATAEIAILGGDVTLHGHYAGNVHFLGRNLDLADGAVVSGLIDIAGAKHVTIRGNAAGGVEGSWDRLFEATREGTTP